jgi:hypothetical protein
VDRDAEMMKIARLSRTSNHAVIVLGDFNDVAWSETTSLFQKVSGLLDLRKGRGLFNTYNAKSWIMRWPLDHIFTSPEFRVFEVERGSKVQSDHFPFFTKLSFEPERAEEQQPPPPSPEQLQRAFDQIDNEREEDEKGGCQMLPISYNPSRGLIYNLYFCLLPAIFVERVSLSYN